MIYQSTLKTIFLFSILFILEIYFFINISNPDQGSLGLGFLIISFIGGLLFVLYKLYKHQNIYLKKSTLFLVVWIFYYFYKIIYDVGVFGIHEKLLSTSGGILTFYLLGCFIWLVIQDLSNLQKRESRVIFTFLFTCFILMLTYFTVSLYLDFSSRAVISDNGNLKYIPEYNALYQRPADFITIAFMILSLLLLIQLQFKNFILNKLFFLNYTIILILAVISLQLLNSNKVVPLLLAQFCLICIIQFWKKFNTIVASKLACKQYITFNTLLFNKHLMKKFYFAIIICISIIIIILVSNEVFNLQLEKYRVFSIFDLQEGGSLATRFHIYKVFWEQIDYAPFLGVIDVYQILDMKNTHSFLLDMLVSLGVVGSFLFFIYITYGMYEVLHKKYAEYSKRLRIDLFVFGYFATVVLLALISVGINWIVFWFVLGLTVFPINLEKQKEEID